jgi:hypothetical protein
VGSARTCGSLGRSRAIDAWRSQPVGTAKSRLRLALARLRLELEDAGSRDALALDCPRALPGQSGNDDGITTPNEEP